MICRVDDDDDDDDVVTLIWSYSTAMLILLPLWKNVDVDCSL